MSFNNKVFSPAMLEFMADDYDRLFLAAQTLHPEAGIDGPSALARFVDESPQSMTNWRSRGLPKAKITALARKVGCRADYVELGALPMVDDGKQSSAVKAPKAEEQRAHYGPTVSDEEAALLRDLRELLPDRREHYAREIRTEANVARAYKAMGHPDPVPDDRVAQFIGPAPALPPVERRASERRESKSYGVHFGADGRSLNHGKPARQRGAK